MAAWWDDLGDDELNARLVQRGIPVDKAQALVANRELDVVRSRLEELLA